jgi:branched-chain amino acid transport system substrate-binding protein
MHRRTALRSAAFAAAPLLLVRCVPPSAGSDKGPIRIGQSAPVTGSLSQVGCTFRDAIQAVFSEANAQGGIAGRPLELVTLDDQDQPERTAVNVKLLASEHRASALFGFVGGGAHRAGALGAMEEGLPYIAPVSGSQELRSGLFPWVYTVRPGHVEEIRLIARHTQQIGVTRVSLLAEYNSQGWELRDALLGALASQGRAAASISSIDHQGGAYSLRGAVASVLAGDPQAVILGADYVATAHFVEAIRRAGFNGYFYTLSTVGGDALMTQLGPLAAGLSVTQVVPFPWSSSSPVGRRFQSFCGRHRITPSFPAMEAFISATLLVEALGRGRGGAPAQIAESLAAIPPRDFGGFVAGFHSGDGDRRTPPQVELTVFSRAGKFIQ